MNKRVLIIGASNKPERYSYKALKMLLEFKYEPFPISVKKGSVLGVDMINEKRDIAGIHTVTLYINPSLQEQYFDYVLSLKPRRVIFNPGTENQKFKALLEKEGIETLEACTLVLLSTGQF